MLPVGTGGVAPALSGEALLEAVPEARDVANLSVVQVANLPSMQLGLSHLRETALQIEAAADAGASGIVVVQGTDTLEEAAVALDHLVAYDLPVVLTAAMRSPRTSSADGPGNLLAAIRVAALGRPWGQGVVVVMNDEIHAARYVSKRHTVSTAAFQSADVGPLGRVVEGVPRFAWTLPDAPRAIRRPIQDDRRVGVVALGMADDGALIELGQQGGYHGLVVAAAGAGHASLAATDRIEAACRHIPIVVTSRTGAGLLLHATYGYPGGEMDLADRGAILALNAQPARLRMQLLLLLSADYSIEEIRDFFRGLCCNGWAEAQRAPGPRPIKRPESRTARRVMVPD